MDTSTTGCSLLQRLVASLKDIARLVPTQLAMLPGHLLKMLCQRLITTRQAHVIKLNVVRLR